MDVRSLSPELEQFPNAWSFSSLRMQTGKAQLRAFLGTSEACTSSRWNGGELGQPCSLEVVVIEKQGWDSLPLSKEPVWTINHPDNDKCKHLLWARNSNPHQHICWENWSDLLSQPSHRWCFRLLHPRPCPFALPLRRVRCAGRDAAIHLLPRASCHLLCWTGFPRDLETTIWMGSGDNEPSAMSK